MNELISVIIPIFQYTPFFDDALNSITEQSYKTLEIIIVSDDKSEKIKNIIESRKDRRIKLITGNQSGLAAALNLGINIASGEFIARMDADDIADINKLEKQIIFLKTNNLDICGTNIQTYGISNYTIKFPERNSDIKLFSLFGSPLAHPTVLGKTGVFKENLYDESFKFVEDYELWQRLIIKKYKIGNLQESLLKYRLHSNQASKVNMNQISISITIANNLFDSFYSKFDNKLLPNLKFGFNYSYNLDEIVILCDEIYKLGTSEKVNFSSFSRIINSLFAKIKRSSLYTFFEYLKMMNKLRIKPDIGIICFILLKAFTFNAINNDTLYKFKKIYK